MTLQVLNIVFSIILLPVNVFSAFWLFREALNLTDMTLGEFVEKNYFKTVHIRRHRQRKLWKILTEFFIKTAPIPKNHSDLQKHSGFAHFPALHHFLLRYIAQLTNVTLNTLLSVTLSSSHLTLLSLYGAKFTAKTIPSKFQRKKTFAKKESMSGRKT